MSAIASYADKIEKIINYGRTAGGIILQSRMGMASGDAPPPAPPPTAPATVNNTAPAPATMTKAQLKMQQRFILIHGITSDEDTLRIAAELEQQAADIQSREAPRTREHRQRLKDLWELSVNLTKPSYAKVPMENMWLRDIVTQNMFHFLPMMVKTTPPRKGYTTIKASTLQGWYNIFVHLIIENTRDVNGAKKGLTVLGEDRRLDKLNDQVVQLIFDNNLSRTLNKKHYFGRYEVQQILGTLLEASSKKGPQRLVNLQMGFAILIAEYSTARPCGLAAASKWLKDRGQYLKLKDFRLISRGPMNWEVQIHMTHFKGALNSAVADEQHIILKSVGKAHNAIFDPTLWAISYWFARGAFEKNYQTLVEFCNDESAEIKLNPNKLEEAAFLAGNPGGHGFIDPPTPQASSALSSSFSEWAYKAGLPANGMYALRRDAGNMFSLQLGTEAAKDIMNHATTGVFRRHYSKNTANFDLVGVRNGEVAGANESFPGQVLMEQSDKTLFLSAAVENMVRTKKDLKKKESKEDADHFDEEYEKMVNEDSTITCLSEKADNTYKALLACMCPKARTYNNDTYHINLLMQRATESTEEMGHPRILAGCGAKARECQANLIALLLELRRAHAKIRRTVRREENQAANQSYSADSISGTTAEREQAVKDLSKPSEVLLAAARTIPIVQQSDNDVFCGNNSEIGVWKARLEEAICEDEDEDRSLEEEGNRYHALLSTMHATITIKPPKNADDESAIAPEPLANTEEDEVDILDIPLPNIKFALLQQFLNPIFRDRNMTLVVDEATGKESTQTRYVCSTCSQDLASPSKLQRHIVKVHAPWKELITALQKPRDRKISLSCPSDDYTTFGRDIESHLLNRCIDKSKYKKMKEQYDIANIPYRNKKRNGVVTKAPLFSGKQDNDDQDDSDKENQDGSSLGEREIKARSSKRKRHDKKYIDSDQNDSDKDNQDNSSLGKKEIKSLKRKRHDMKSDDDYQASDSESDATIETIDDLQKLKTNESDAIIETIDKKDLQRKLKTKKPLATYVNILLRIAETVEKYGKDTDDVTEEA